MQSRSTVNDLLAAMPNAEIDRVLGKLLIELRSPLQLQNFTAPPPGIVVVGAGHIVEGSVFMIGGAPDSTRELNHFLVSDFYFDREFLFRRAGLLSKLPPLQKSLKI
jgi:hypothetical protein